MVVNEVQEGKRGLGKNGKTEKGKGTREERNSGRTVAYVWSKKSSIA